jgi:hypothetical protein
MKAASEPKVEETNELMSTYDCELNAAHNALCIAEYAKERAEFIGNKKKIEKIADELLLMSLEIAHYNIKKIYATVPDEEKKL